VLDRSLETKPGTGSERPARITLRGVTETLELSLATVGQIETGRLPALSCPRLETLCTFRFSKRDGTCQCSYRGLTLVRVIRIIS
jgi:hypothetical protein